MLNYYSDKIKEFTYDKVDLRNIRLHYWCDSSYELLIVALDELITKKMKGK